ncbi:MAG: tyrosine-type recombinase/integrase [Terriglobia bacterium]
MKHSDFLSVLADRFSDFVTFRRLGGVDSHSQIQLLWQFDRFLCQEGFHGRWPTREVVESYVATTKHLHPGSRQNRLSVVRQFCRYLRQFEPGCFVPETMLLRQKRPCRVPHIYTDTQLQAILKAARGLPPTSSLRPKTYFTLFGLLYTTGLRCGEAYGLNLSDVDLEQNLLFIRKAKFGKSRWVPISASTSEPLQRYLNERRGVAPVAPECPFFVTPTGRRLYHTNVDLAFRQVLKRCALRGGKGCPGPRLHHLRHSFACKRLLAWYREGKDVNALLPALATYLGHVKVTSTQVYLQATAELLEEANQRFLNNFRQHVSPKGKLT